MAVANATADSSPLDTVKDLVSQLQDAVDALDTSGEGEETAPAPAPAKPAKSAAAPAVNLLPGRPSKAKPRTK
jgi:hypothetical protein